MRKLIRSLLAVGALAGLAACGDKVNVTQPNDVVITGAPVTAISVGAKVQLSASVAVTWSSSASNVATVDATGLVTAVAAGTASITAKSTANANKQASVTITVTALSVTSVTVQPPNAILAPGQTLQVVANVLADPGVARTVTWSSSNTSVATVTSAGVVTAVAAGTASITATSTANTQVSGSMALTVRAPVSARIDIQKVTVAGNLQAPVNLAAVAGQIDVSIDVDPGDFVASKVDLLVDNVVVGSQNFTAVQSEEFRLAHAFDIANAVSTIVISFNTAAFNPTTGAVLAINQNGPHTLSAKLTVVGGGGGNSAVPSLAVVFANPNTFVSTFVYTGTTAAATSPTNGLAFNRGGVTFSVLPVIYNPGQSLAAGTLFFGQCDTSPTGTRNIALVAPAAGSSAWTAPLPQTIPTGGAAVNTVSNYEYGCAGAGELPFITATDNLGNQLFVGTFPAVGTRIRLDNRPPGPPTFIANPNGRENGWINGAVTIGTNGGATSNGWLTNGAADLGVGGYTRQIRVGAGPTAAAADAATASATLVTPAPTVTNVSDCAVISATDALGNESALPAGTTVCTTPPVAPSTAVLAQHLAFGVDIAPPTVAWDVTSLAANARVNTATIATEFVLTVADTGAVGNSGMLSLAGGPAKARVVRRTAAGTVFLAFPNVASDCVIGSLNAALTVCSVGTLRNDNAAGLAFALPLASTTIAGLTTNGYYADSSQVFDAAGNISSIGPRVIAFDNVPATATNPAVPATITGSFSAASFLNDNLSIRDYYWTVTYTTALIAPTTATIAAAPTVVDAFNAATLNNINFAVNATINTFLGLQNGQGAAPVAYPGAANLMSALNLFVRDQTQAAYTGPATSPVAPTVPAAAGVSVTNFTGAFAAATSNTPICAGTLPAGCAAVPTSTNFTATATGTTAVFNNPFTRVDFYAADATNTNLVLIGSVAAGAASLVDNGATRVWTYTLPMTAASLYTTLGGVSPAVVGPVNVYAFGASPNGPVALVSAAVAQTINP